MRTLLIADYSESYYTLLKETLCQQYQVTVCSDGITALKLLDTLHPDILILDLMLPKLDGLSVLRYTQRIPPVVLCLTPILPDRAAIAAEELGVDWVLLKPCSIRTIIKRLADLTHNYEHTNTTYAKESSYRPD